MRPALAELIDSHDTQAARIAELEGQVLRLRQSGDLIYGTTFTDLANFREETATLRTRLSTLEKAAGDVVSEATPVMLDVADCHTHHPKNDFRKALDKLAALLAEKGSKG
jgi:hypothetical protein